MVIIAEKMGVIININKIAPDGFKGFDDVKLCDDMFSPCLTLKDDENGQEYCITGGQFSLNSKIYLGVGIGAKSAKDNSYVIGDLDLERITLFDVTDKDEKQKKGDSAHIRTIIKKLAIILGKTLANYTELINKIYKELLGLEFSKYTLINARFKCLLPIPYTVNDKGFFYQEGTIFTCKEFCDFSNDKGDIVRKIKFVHDKSKSEIFIDPAVLYSIFRMVNEKGNTIFP